MSSNAATIAQSANFRQQLSQIATPKNVFKVTNARDPNAAVNQNFPVSLGTPDPQDERYFLQKQLVGNNAMGVIPGVGQAIVGPEYFDYVKRKEEVVQQAEFQSWLMKQADFSTPESSEYWYQHHPWMLTKRVEQVNRVADLQKQIGSINIQGPQTEDDWKLLFAIHKGLVQVPTMAPHMLNQDPTITSNYITGMFSPMIMAGITPPTADNFKVPWTNPTDPNPPPLRPPQVVFPSNWSSYQNFGGLGVQTP